LNYAILEYDFVTANKIGFELFGGIIVNSRLSDSQYSATASYSEFSRRFHLATWLENNCQCTEVRFVSFLSGFITTIVVNPQERKLAKRTPVQWLK
jgi:hypothetical protein